MSLLGPVRSLSINGAVIAVKSDCTYNLGHPIREVVMGADQRVHGDTQKANPAMIKGSLTVSASGLTLTEIVTLRDGVGTLELASGRVFQFPDLTFKGDGDVNSTEDELEFEFYGRNRAGEV